MFFPLKDRPKDSYHEAPRNFGARRSQGKRKHAGCDLYAPVGTPVFAVADGVVTSVEPFYLGSWEVTVDHGDFTVRYGEVQKQVAEGIRVGAKVQAGQQIGQIGRLEGLKISMVHFEMYANTATGALTVRSNAPYQRRKDLIDPTKALDYALMISGRAASPCLWYPGLPGGQFGFTAGML